MKATLKTVEPSKTLKTSEGNPHFVHSKTLDITRLDVEICESLSITRLRFWVTNGKTFDLTLFGQPMEDAIKEHVKKETENGSSKLKTVQP